MFKWMHLRPRRRKLDSVPEPSEVERDSGEEEYESHEEAEGEVAPSGMTRIKTDNV
jgi:hypothetical protein